MTNVQEIVDMAPTWCPLHDYRMGEWLSREIPPKDYLLGDWLHTTARILLAGDTGLGKSMLLMELAFHVATGQAFLHWSGGKPRKVLYIDSEMGAEEIKDRLQGLKLRHGAIADNLVVLSREDFPDASPFDTEEGQAWVLERVNEAQADLVVFDNLMTLVAGDLKDEDTWKAIEPLRTQLSAKRVAQIWVHHTGHNTSRFYGTKTMSWQMTAVIQLDNLEREEPIAFKLSFTKARGRRHETMEEYEPTTITFDGHRWGWSSVTADRKRPQLGDVAKRFYDALENALAKLGKPLPRNENLPNTNGIETRLWQQECETMGLLDTCTTDESRNAKFRKYKGKLDEKGLIREHKPWVWLP